MKKIFLILLAFFLLKFITSLNVSSVTAAGQACCNPGNRYCAQLDGCAIPVGRTCPSTGGTPTNCSSTETCYANVSHPRGTCFAAGTTPTPGPGPCAGACRSACQSDEVPTKLCAAGTMLCCEPLSNTGGTIKNGPEPTSCIGTLGFETAIGCIPVENPQAFATFFIKWGMRIAGGIALALIGYSGFITMSSSGDPKKLKAGQELLTAAISGLILLLFGVFALRFIGVDILRLDQFGFGT